MLEAELQNRAIRIYLGVHRFSSNHAINGDIGWTMSSTRRKVAMIRFYNRLLDMPETRLTKRVFLWDKCQATHGWAHEIQCILNDNGLSELYVNGSKCQEERIWALLHEKDCTKWISSVSNSPKLRTYALFKKDYCVEPYVYLVLNRKYRSVLAKLRTGILPLEIEVGRWRNTAVELRLCKMCNQSVVEDEYHFLFSCDLYKNERETFFQNVSSIEENFVTLDTETKWGVLMSAPLVNITAKYVWTIFTKRQGIIFQ